MKILYICSEFGQGMLSFASTIINTIASSSEYEVYVLVVSSEKQGLSYKDILDKVPSKNITHLEYPTDKIGRSLYKIFPIDLWRKVHHIVQKNNIKTIHLLTGDYGLALFFRFSTIVNKYNIYYTVHDLIPHERYEKKIKDRLFNYFTERATRIFIKKIDNLVTSSREQYNLLTTEFTYKKIRYHRFPSLITTPILQGSQECPELKGIKNYFLFFGHVDVYKGVNLLYDIFADFENEFNKETLVIAGKGEYYFPYKKEALNVIRINRFIKDEEVRFLFLNAKCVVFPYISATQSGVMSLAYKFQTPLVMSDIPYFKDNIIEGKTGITFQANNKEDLKKALRTIMTKVDRLKMQEEQEQYYKQNFSLEALFADLNNIYCSDINS